MKNLKTTITILSLMLYSCSKNDEKPIAIVYPEENPLQGYLEATRLNEFGSLVDGTNVSTYYEYGFSFKPTVEGKINSIYLRIPKTGINTKVTIWDVATRFPIYTRSDVFSFTTSINGNIANLTPIQLEKNKEYMITMHSKNYYRFRRDDFNTINYPIQSGNISITGFYKILTKENVSLFPTNNQDNYYEGNLSFNFQRTN